MGRIFISHAQADDVLVEPFVELLRIGLNLKEENIFCTSLEGMGIPRGSTFVRFIKKQFKASDFVIMVLTPKYYESVFCLCELGATWITGSNAMPLLVPPLEYEDLKAVLTGVQSGYINDKKTLNELRDRLIEATIASGATHAWETKRDTFIKAFPRIQRKLKGRDSVPAAEHAKLKAMYDEAQNTIVEREEAIETLEERVEELEKLKDQKQVKELRKKYKNEQQQFDDLVKVFVKAAGQIPNTGVEALFHEHRGTEYVLEDRFVYKHEWEDAEEAERDGYVTIDGSLVSRNESSPKMDRAASALSDMADFMSDVSEEFSEEFVEEHDVQFDLTSRDFWREAFEL